MVSKKKNQNILNRKIVDFLITGGILALCFVLSLVVERIFKTESLIPCIFILGSFLTSVITDGYIYAGISVLFGVLLVNYAFAFPQFGFNFTIQENLVSIGIHPVFVDRHADIFFDVAGIRNAQFLCISLAGFEFGIAIQEFRVVDRIVLDLSQ